MLRNVTRQLDRRWPPTLHSLSVCGSPVPAQTRLNDGLSQNSRSAVRSKYLLSRCYTAAADAISQTAVGADPNFHEDQAIKVAKTTDAVLNGASTALDQTTENSLRGVHSDDSVHASEVAELSNHARNNRNYASDHEFRWNKSTPNLLLKGLLLRDVTEQANWMRWVASRRSRRLPVLVLQLMIRERTLPLRHFESSQTAAVWAEVEQLLTGQSEWLATIEKAGSSIAEVRRYAAILQGNDDAEQRSRFLADDEFKPLFLFNWLIRRGTDRIDSTSLHALVQYCHRHYARRRLKQNRSWWKQPPIPLLEMAQDHPGSTLALLTHHCWRIEPRFLTKVAHVVTACIDESASNVARGPEEYRKQCGIFNAGLYLFGPRRHEVHAIRQSLPFAYIWRAVEVVLDASASLPEPLILNERGFKAVREVLAMQRKTLMDKRSSARHASSWPPYLEPADGMDEVAEPEEAWSRSVSAGAMMQEEGFALDDEDLALNIIQGFRQDGTPTIHQQTHLGRGRHLGRWEASIRATRNTYEAWSIFQKNPDDPSAMPGIGEYTAMFQKLLARDVSPRDYALPGDKALNFPIPLRSNLTEFEKIRLHPPSVPALYMQMLSDGVVLDRRCRCVLVANAESLHDVREYLSGTGLTQYHPLSGLPLFAEAAMSVEPSVFAAYVSAMLRLSRSPGTIIPRAIRLVKARLDHKESADRPWASFVWHLIMQSIARPSTSFEVSDPTRIHYTLEILEETLSTDTMNFSLFLQLGKTLRMIVRQQLGQLLDDLASDKLWSSNFSRLLYNGRTEATNDQLQEVIADADTPVSVDTAQIALQIRKAATKLNATLHVLLEREAERRSLLDGDFVDSLAQMSCRKDPVTAPRLYRVVLNMVFLGQFDETARILQWALAEWGQDGLMETLSALEELPRDADFTDVLCLFRMVCEPMLAPEVTEALRTSISREDSPWVWPGNEMVLKFADEQESTGLDELKGVLEWVRYRQAKGRVLEVQKQQKRGWRIF